MKTNPFLTEFIKNSANYDVAETKLRLQRYTKINGLTITPKVFNDFYLEIEIFEQPFDNENPTISLSIEKARKLGKWLLEVTNGVEETHETMQEIVKLSNKLMIGKNIAPSSPLEPIE